MAIPEASIGMGLLRRTGRPKSGCSDHSAHRPACAITGGIRTTISRHPSNRGSAMLISTMNDIPGYQITQVLGEVFGLTVRSRNVGSQIGASFKSLAGGELKGMTKNLHDSRQQVIERMVGEAEARGGNAVVAMRFDTSEMGGNWTEICAYGTAVIARPLG
ncbi:MAG TPA: YbjQ family protein [Frankiaceae bacterium]|nr:YbjQ family protein [Frankiaceae bacterium]